MGGLVWFRSDLRMDDNAALAQACSEGPAVGVFVVSPQQWQEHDWAAAKVDLLLRSLRDLSGELSALGIPLRILTVPRFQGAPAALLKLAEDAGCEKLYFNREYEWNEARRDAEVTAAFEGRGLDVRAHDGQVILPPGSVTTRQGSPYRVFSPFRNRWVERLEELGEPRTSPRPARQAGTGMKSDPVPSSVEGFRPGPSAKLWGSGEAHALERLQRFAQERMGSYAGQRDVPGTDGTSALSPYLSLGVLSPRRCLEVAMAQNGGRLSDGDPGAVAWINELIWREFYEHLLVHFPRLSKGRSFRAEYEAIPWSQDAEGFEAWCTGRTGYPLVDAGMRQLLETGWMHNRLRMITAMFLTKHLLVDWREGERFFMQHLVDGKLSANNGGWQWSASTGTDAQPYFRVFNPWLQSKRYDPQGAYIQRFVPELAPVPASALHDPRRLAKAVAEAGVDYPSPIVEHKVARERAISTFRQVARG